ncbi:MAG: acyl-CoA dehydrogenase family protein, partial [Dehalococcoidia bacterium]
MVTFELSEADRMVKQVAHEFAAKEIRPVAARHDEEESYPWEVVRKGATLGLAGSAWGGPGLEETGITSLVVAEELAWGCGGIATAMLA